MSESLGEAVLFLGIDAKKFKEGVDNAQKKAASLEKQFKKLGKSLKDAGKSMSKFVTLPIAGLGALSVALADTQLQAEAGLAAALRFTGDASKETLEDFKAFATELQGITTVGDETTLQMLQTATSMGVTGESAKKAVKEAIGLSAAFGIAESTAVRMTASLAEGDTTMLNRYIPTLKGVEDEAERVALAHHLLGGAFDVATTQAETGLGPMKQLKNQLGDLGEQIGEIIIDFLTPLIAKLKGVISWFQDLSPATKKTIVIIAGVAAAIGPVLVALGSLLGAIGLIAGALAPGGALIVGATTFATILMGPVGIAIAIGAVALAITSFLSKEGGAIEEYWADGAASVSELVRGVKDLEAAFEEIKPDIHAVNELADEFRGTNDKLFREIRAGVADGRNYDEVLEILHERFAEGTVEGDLLRDSLADVRAGFEDVNEVVIETTPEVHKVKRRFDEFIATLDTFPGTATKAERAMWALQNSMAKMFTEFEDVAEVSTEFGTVGLPALVPPIKEVKEEISKAAGIEGVKGFGNELKGLHPKIDGAIGKLQSFLGIFEKIFGMFGKGGKDLGIGNFFSTIKNAFSGGGKEAATAWGSGMSEGYTKLGDLFGGLGKEGATGILSGLTGIFKSASSFLPVIGPLLATFGPMLFKGVKALGKKIWSGLKSMFGGPSGAELEARKVAGAMDSMFKDIMSQQQLVEAGHEQWKINNVVQRDLILATGGTIADVEAIWKKYQDVAKDPEAAKEYAEFWKAKLEEVQGKLAETGQSFTEYRDSVINSAAAAADAASASATDVQDSWTKAAKTISTTFDGVEIDIPVNFSKGTGYNDNDTGDVPHLASGGIVTRRTLAVIGESGPEAVVPLSGGGGAPGGGDVAARIASLEQTLLTLLPRAVGDSVKHGMQTIVRRR